MSPVIPFRRRSKHRYAPLALAALTAAVLGFAATWAFVTWQSSGADLSRGADDNSVEYGSCHLLALFGPPAMSGLSL
jgi:hypothetical protein